ncbi:MAG TPA: FUSC family protein [Streptosporangiaceae bacterium]|nr:FUSC family protein [Streptosporangiaceae bacterium]
MSGEPPSPFAAWFQAARRTLAAEIAHGGWFNFGQFRWADVNVGGALRAGAGVITPLALGLVTGHLEYGVFAALGALPAGFVSFQGVSRTRVSAVVLAAVGMAVATFIGGAAGYSSQWLLVPAIVVFSYLTGLLVTLGQRFMVVGLQWSIQLMIASGIPLAAGDAAVRSVLVLAGGLWQGALVVASWAIMRGGRERSALASAYRALSEYAAGFYDRPPGARQGQPPPPTFGSDVLDDPNPLLSAQARYRMMTLLEQAERIRLRLAAVAAYDSDGSLLKPAARVLDDLAEALEARHGHRERAAALDRALETIAVPQDVPWQWAGESLLGEMRAAVRLLGRLDQHDIEPAAGSLAPGGRRRGAWRSDLAAALFSLRAGIGTSTEAGRHALRLAVVAAIGEIVAVASGLPHGYWIVLTILIVLRPDYTSTIYRSVQRAAGTVIGAGLGVATALLLHVGTAAVVAAVGVTMTIAYAVFAANYLLYAVFLTDFVVILLALIGQTAEQTAVTRLVGTAVGGALALIGYLAWPSWGSEPAQQKLAQLFEALGCYVSLVLRAYARPGQADMAAIHSAELTARRARADAEAAADRLADEPPRPPVTARLAYALTGTARRIAHAGLTLHAAVGVRPAGAGHHAAVPGQCLAAPMRASVDRFADGVEASARVIAGSLLILKPPADLPPLREMQKAIFSEQRGSADGSGRGDGSGSGSTGPDPVLFRCTDEFTDAFDSAADILRRHLGGEGGE